MQPLVKVDEVIRFKENAIVRRLLDESQKRGFGLNQLVMDPDFSQADWEQFYQLIGYSLCGYHELSRVSDSSALEASDAARELFGSGVGGCRDSGCEIHSGVNKKLDRADRIV